MGEKRLPCHTTTLAHFMPAAVVGDTAWLHLISSFDSGSLGKVPFVPQPTARGLIVLTQVHKSLVSGKYTLQYRAPKVSFASDIPLISFSVFSAAFAFCQSYNLAFSCNAPFTSFTTSCEHPYDDWYPKPPWP